MTRRPLTDGERVLARSMFGDALDCDATSLCRRRWWPFQTRDLVMAPCGTIHFHPQSTAYSADFAAEPVSFQAFFLHELTHVWQYQSGVSLILRRHPFCRYAYVLTPGKPFLAYGLEQQAEIVRHTHLLRSGFALPGRPGGAAYEEVVAPVFGTSIADPRPKVSPTTIASD